MHDAEPGELRLFDNLIASRPSENRYSEMYRHLQFANQQAGLIIVQATKARQPQVSPCERLPLSYQLRNIFCISSILYSLVSFYNSFLSRGKCRTCVQSTLQRPSPDERRARESCPELKAKSWHHELAWKVAINGRKRVMQFLLLREWHPLFHTFIQKWLNPNSTKRYFLLSKVKQFW